MTLNIAIKGGLGNQLFQYAFGTYLQKKYKCRIFYDLHPLNQKIDNLTPRPYLLHKLFQIEDITSTSVHELFHTYHDSFFKRIYKKIIRSFNNYVYMPEHAFSSEPLKENATYYLDGYWQDKAYAKEIVNELNSKSALFVQKKYDGILTKGSVAIHVRRGDYVSNPVINAYHGVCDITYFNRAISFLEKEIETGCYVVFSDDIVWAKENLKTPKPIHFMEGNTLDPISDLFMMKSCHHMILSNSSFSCWAAYLNEHADKKIIVPENWTATLKTKDLPLFDQTWIVL